MARHGLQERAWAARQARTGDLPHDVVVFTGLLHDIGVAVSPASSLQALEALTLVSLERREDVRSALGCCLSGSAAGRALFDAVFDVFWSTDDPALPGLPGEDELSGEGNSIQGVGEAAADAVHGEAGGRPDAEGLAGRATYGRSRGGAAAVQAGRRRDVEELASRLARLLGRTTGRRMVAGEPGERVDLRATVRTNLRFGGELVQLRHTRRRRDRPRMVVLCDVSSSMRPSLPLFLAFVHALTTSVRRVEVAVFNVDTVPVTEVFRRMDLRPALRWLTHQQVALSGGTRIGHCLHAFLEDLEGRGALGADTVALVLSDGWDVGEPELLGEQMRRLRRQVGRVVWCDPHAAASGFDPQVQGLRVALPFVDDHLDFSSVTSLAALVDRLADAPRRTSPVGTVPAGPRERTSDDR
jgi:uncharacterized protein with von Willebrand factor type A (vWA) domain